MLITNSLSAEAKLVKLAKSCNKEHSDWFVLKPSTLFKGLGEGKKAEQKSVNCQISHCKIKFKPVCIYCIRVNEVFICELVN